MKRLFVIILAVLMLASLIPVSASDQTPVETDSVYCSKTWEGDTAENRPESITVRLWNGATEVQSIEIKPNSYGYWEGMFTGVPKYDESGNIISYTVTEDSVDGYICPDPAPVNYVVYSDITYGNKVTPASSESYDLEGNYVVGNKGGSYFIWTASELTDAQKAHLIIRINAINLQGLGKSLTTDNTTFEFGDGSVFTYVQGNETTTVTISGGKIIFGDTSVWSLFYQGSLQFFDSPEANIVNTYDPVYTLEIPVVKTVEQGGLNAPVGDRTFYYELTPEAEPVPMSLESASGRGRALPDVSYSGALSACADGESGDFKITVNGAGSADGKIILTGTLDEFWALYGLSVTELPDGISDGWVYQSGSEYAWTAEPSFNFETDALERMLIFAPGAEEGSESMLFTNTYTNNDRDPETGTLTVSKTVSGNAASKTDEFEFTLTFSDEAGKALAGEYSYTGTSDGSTAISGTIVSGGTIKLKDGGSVTVSGLPVGAAYTVDEAASDGYKVTADGASGTITANGCTAKFTNTRNSISISVTKAWSDNNAADRPTSVTVLLYRDGKVFDRVVLSGDNGWTKTWAGLYDGYEWAVDEVVPSGYARQITQSGYNFTITNYIPVPQTGESMMLWVWIAVGVVAVGGIAWLVISGRKKKGAEDNGTENK